MTTVTKPPSRGELECLEVLWQAEEEGKGALRVSQVCQELARRRAGRNEPDAALSTVSGYLRSALDKGLVREVRVLADGRMLDPSRGALRGLRSSARSPSTAYQAEPPSVVFEQDFKTIFNAYPPLERERRALVDFASAIGIAPQTVQSLEAWLEDQLR